MNKLRTKSLFFVNNAVAVGSNFKLNHFHLSPAYRAVHLLTGRHYPEVGPLDVVLHIVAL